MTFANWLALWVIVSVLASPLIGEYLHNRKVNRKFKSHLATEQRRVRLENLVQLADEYEAASTDKERMLIFRKATDLGFTDDSRPFALDEDIQPHLPKAS